MFTGIHQELSSTNFRGWEVEWDLEMDVDDWHFCIFTSKIKVRRLFPVAQHGPLWTSDVPHTEHLCRVLVSDVLQKWMTLSLRKLHPLFLSASKNYLQLRIYLEQVFYLRAQPFSFGTLCPSLKLASLSVHPSPLCRWFQQLELTSLQMMPDAPSPTGSLIPPRPCTQKQVISDAPSTPGLSKVSANTHTHKQYSRSAYSKQMKPDMFS